MALFRFLHSTGELGREEAEELRETALREGKHPIEALAGRVSEGRVAELLTSQLGLPLIDLGSVSIEPAALKAVNKELAARYDAIPIRMNRGRLVMAFANPLDADAIRTIEFSSRIKIEAAVGELGQVREAVRHHYYFNAEIRDMLEEASTQKVEVLAGGGDDDEITQDLLSNSEDKATVIRLVELLLVDGLRLDASDIHIEPTSENLAVRYRIHGVLERGVTVPKNLQNQVVARIKVMASLDITERRRPQDGAIRVSHQNRQADVRVSCLPTPLGEKVVLRLLDPEAKSHNLANIGVGEEGIAVLRRESRRPEGLILISGPTGSGKSTTAHSILSDIADSALNIVTIENPVEYRLKGVTQVEVNEKQGVSFAGTLRSILRQDPDVIFVGEIRDAETAKIALQAAQTGHLVISTVHTIDATASISRLLDLGMDPLSISACLRLVIAQRLVRRICESCRGEPRPPNEEEAERLRGYGYSLDEIVVPVGCPNCRDTGYEGRMGIYELLPVSHALRGRIERQEPETVLRAQARADGVASMQDLALAGVKRGQTSLDEVARVVPPEERPASETEAPLLGAQAEPEAAPAAPVAAPRVTTPEAPERYRVMVVDDDPEIGSLMAGCLKRCQLPVDGCSATSGVAALEVLEREAVHLILLDISMPGMSGLEVCAKIREQSQWDGIPVFMLTARGDTEAKAEAFRAGADDYLVKPVVPTELVARVERALRRAFRPAAVPTETGQISAASESAKSALFAVDVPAEEVAVVEPATASVDPAADPDLGQEAAQPHGGVDTAGELERPSTSDASDPVVGDAVEPQEVPVTTPHMEPVAEESPAEIASDAAATREPEVLPESAVPAAPQKTAVVPPSPPATSGSSRIPERGPSAERGTDGAKSDRNEAWKKFLG